MKSENNLEELVMIFNEWRLTKLGDEFELVYGKSLPKTKRIEGDYPVYGSGGITGTHNQFLVRGPGIIIGRKGTVGSVYYEQKDYFPIDTTYYVTPSNKYDLKFMYYFLKTQSLDKMNSHSAVPGLNREEVYKKSIMIPDIKEQKAIAEILSSLDDKIELNNAMNETLEEMAQALFKRWFVDFEFPNEKGQPYKSSGGEMVESELGMIPKGWDIITIKEFGEVITGKTPSTKVKDNYGDKYPFITIPDMHNNIFVLNTERYLSQLGNNTQPKKLIPSNSLIVSCIATVGLVAINSQDSHTNQQINALILNDIKKLYYLYFALKGQSQYLNLLGSSGTTTKNVNKSMFEKIKIINPEQKMISEYHKICKPIFEVILENMKQNNYLKETRDSLLPKLMSGEIRVSDLNS